MTRYGNHNRNDRYISLDNTARAIHYLKDIVYLHDFPSLSCDLWPVLCVDSESATVPSYSFSIHAVMNILPVQSGFTVRENIQSCRPSILVQI